jgi:hypothetical protein
MPYWIVSPSSNNNPVSFMHWVAFQIDGPYSVVEGECRVHLKYKNTTFFVYTDP